MTAAVEPYDVVVVGGGQAGLAAAWQLRQLGMRFRVLEAAEQLGHTWHGRWESLRLFTPAEFDALPGRPFPAPTGSDPGKEAVANYLRDYAAAFEAGDHRPTRYGLEVATQHGEAMASPQVSSRKNARPLYCLFAAMGAVYLLVTPGAFLDPRLRAMDVSTREALVDQVPNHVRLGATP